MDEVSKREELAYAAKDVASKNYAARCRAEGKPLTMRGLKAEIRKEVFVTIGQPPMRKRPARVRVVQPIGNAWLDLTSAVKQLAATPADLQALAARTSAPLHTALLNESRLVAVRLAAWITALESKEVDADAEVTRDQLT